MDRMMQTRRGRLAAEAAAEYDNGVEAVEQRRKSRFSVLDNAERGGGGGGRDSFMRRLRRH